MNKGLTKWIASLIVASLIVPSVALGRSIDEISAEEEVVAEQKIVISDELQTELNIVNEKYQEVAKLKENISSAEYKIEETKKEIEIARADIAKRKEAMSERMQELQVSGSSATGLASLLNADSFSDFITRVYAVTVLQDSENSKVESLRKDTENLNKMETELAETVEKLSSDQASLEVEAVTLENNISDLKGKLADNQEQLIQLSTEKQTEEERLAQEALAAQKAAEEQAAAEAKAKADAEAKAKASEVSVSSSTSSKESTTSQTTESTSSSSSSQSSANSSNQTQSSESSSTSSSSTSSNNNTTSSESTSSGKTLTVSSTAYSYQQAGLSNYTATGIDLRQNSSVIAVDPSVIPLGTMVEIPGYGIAVAGDTGGAIKGNKIDVHFSTVEACYNWGSRTITITILD